MQVESERIEKEKENLELKESLMRLQCQLKAKERDMMHNTRIKFEGAPLVNQQQSHSFRIQQCVDYVVMETAVVLYFK